MTRAVAAANLLVCQVGFAGGTGSLPEATFAEEMGKLGYTPEEIKPVMDKLPLDLENMLSMIGQSL